MTTAPLNVLDELYLHLDRDDEPWSVQLEIGVEGRVDEERLAGAIVEAARRHPLARARLRPARGTDVRYHWEIADDLVGAPLEVISCGDDAALAAAREDAFGASPSMDEAPPFAVTLAPHRGGDAIMLNLNHAAGDGMSAVRLMVSILRAYAGLPDDLPAVDPLAVRDIGELVSSRSLGPRLARGRALVEQASRAASSPMRIAADGAKAGRAGYGFELLRLGPEELRAVLAQRTEGATVNDVLIAGLAVAIARWNAGHGQDPGRVAITMPINLRPAEWRTEVVGNFASYVSVPLAVEDTVDLRPAVEAAAARTRRIKDEGVAGLVIDLLELPTATLPTGVKRRFQDLITLSADRFVDTAVLSNLGRLDPAPALGGDAGRVRSVWFSAPGRMPLGASLGAATYGDQLFLTLRYRHALFDARAAAAFGSSLRDVLTTT